MTKLLLLGLSVLALTGCGGSVADKSGGTDVPGSNNSTNITSVITTPNHDDYHYIYVQSQIIGSKYYHVSFWKEYYPGYVSKAGVAYLGLELELANSKEMIYFCEPNLVYIAMKNYNYDYGLAIE